jgi:3-hydroxyisobutyrate dehydrogenase
MPLSDQRTVAFVGLGQMGLPMASRLIGAGFRVIGIDPVPAARERAAESGIETSESLADALAADAVILMLPDSNVVESVADRLLAAAGPERPLLIDMSSSDPVRTQALAAKVAAAGFRFVDAPVSGGVPRAKTGELAIMVGGAEADVDLAMPVLEPLGTYIRRVGDAGAGHAVKALNNLLSATHLLASNEATLIAASFGVDPATFVAVVNASSGRSGSTEVKLPRYVLPRTFDSGFRADLLEKDVTIAMTVAAATGIDAPVATRAAERWVELNARLERGADHTAIVRPAEEDAGIILSDSAS